MAKQKLNLFQLAPGAMAEAGTRILSKVMRREFYDSNLAAYAAPLDDMPHHFFRHFGCPKSFRLTQRNNRPWTTLEAASQSSTVCLTHEGTGYQV